MSHVSSMNNHCKYCGFPSVYEDLNIGTDESSELCVVCGFAININMVRDPDGNVRLGANGRPFLERVTSGGYGAMSERNPENGLGSIISFNRPQPDTQIIEIKEDATRNASIINWLTTVEEIGNRTIRLRAGKVIAALQETEEGLEEFTQQFTDDQTLTWYIPGIDLKDTETELNVLNQRRFEILEEAMQEARHRANVTRRNMIIMRDNDDSIIVIPEPYGISFRGPSQPKTSKNGETRTGEETMPNPSTPAPSVVCTEYVSDETFARQIMINTAGWSQTTTYLYKNDVLIASVNPSEVYHVAEPHPLPPPSPLSSIHWEPSNEDDLPF